jgi:hypothetical protein
MSVINKTTSNTSQITASSITGTTFSASNLSSNNITASNITGNLSATTISGTTITAGTLYVLTPIWLKNVYEMTTYVSTNSTVSPWGPFTADYAYGSIFYIPSDYVQSANFQVVIKNIPTDTTKTYTLTLVYYQPTVLFYASTARVSDTTGSNFLLGTYNTYAAPLWNGGTPVVSSAPNLIMQQFSVISIPTSASVYSRYITSSVNVSTAT